jgi:hypothetical protein
MTTLVRRPYYGVVSPGDTIAVNISPPIQVEVEHVTFLTLSKDVAWQLVKPDSIVIQNRTKLPMPFIVSITPANVAVPAPSAIFAALKQWWAARTKA